MTIGDLMMGELRPQEIVIVGVVVVVLVVGALVYAAAIAIVLSAATKQARRLRPDRSPEK